MRKGIENMDLKFDRYSITFKELPNEVSLTYSITGCPNKCEGCHSPHLRLDSGTPLTIDLLKSHVEKYDGFITAICFLGGEWTDNMVDVLKWLKSSYLHLKTGLYTSKYVVDDDILINLDYIKVGEYIKNRGGLTNSDTNQSMFTLRNGDVIEDITYKFWT